MSEKKKTRVKRPTNNEVIRRGTSVSGVIRKAGGAGEPGGWVGRLTCPVKFR